MSMRYHTTCQKLRITDPEAIPVSYGRATRNLREGDEVVVLGADSEREQVALWVTKFADGRKVTNNRDEELVYYMHMDDLGTCHRIMELGITHPEQLETMDWTDLPFGVRKYMGPKFRWLAADLKALYEDKDLSVAQIKSTTGLSHGMVQRRLEAAGTTMRSRKYGKISVLKREGVAALKAAGWDAKKIAKLLELDADAVEASN